MIIPVHNLWQIEGSVLFKSVCWPVHSGVIEPPQCDNETHCFPALPSVQPQNERWRRAETERRHTECVKHHSEVTHSWDSSEGEDFCGDLLKQEPLFVLVQFREGQLLAKLLSNNHVFFL